VSGGGPHAAAKRHLIRNPGQDSGTDRPATNRYAVRLLLNPDVAEVGAGLR